MEERKPIKVMHLRSSGGFYGAEAVMLTLTRELEQMGCENQICCINNLKNPHSELIDAAHRLGIKTSSVDSINLLDWETIREIRAMIKNERFDILHFHDYKASVYGFLASWWLSPKRVVTNHGWINVDWKLSLYQLLEGILYNKFNRVIAVSEKSKKQIRPHIVHKSMIEVITNGIDAAEFASPCSDQCQCRNTLLRTKLCLNDHDRVVGIVGRLSQEKGHEYLFRAFALLKEEIKHTKLLVVGDGVLEKSLKKLCQALELKFVDAREVSDPQSVLGKEYSVVFTGVRMDMSDVYQALDVLVMPSLQEGLPMVLLEAMVSGVPVIATPVGQIPQIIMDGETGFIVQPKAIDGLADVLLKVLNDLGSGKMKSVIRNARILVKEEHSSKAMANKYLETYEWLVE